MTVRTIVLLGSLIGCLAVAVADESPYVGYQEREIKALSAEEVDSLRAGRGMGFALAAELNTYPGPKHVLEMTEQLALDSKQLAKTHRIYESMHDDAVRLGEKVIAAERALDGLFTSGEANDKNLAGAVGRVAELRGRLRLAHLKAHLAMVRILTPEQIRAYNHGRGYAGNPAACPHADVVR